ncbi:hypothetical protein [Promicromonospora aerolata]|uniref:Oxaloacetate decarboxylase n=1 Tax=Promicromonospora aerolata TaxID=195749 RepID=A0ABW4V399_9MICO
MTPANPVDETEGPRFDELRALFINATLKPSPEPSNTDGLVRLSSRIMRAHGAHVEHVRAVDHDIAAGHGGGTKLSRLDHHGLAGVLADGRLRDFDQLRGYRFATWCRGEATRWGGDAVMPFAANVAVEIGGVCLTPGDYVFADASGAVVIPAASLDQVLDEAHRVEAEDTKFLTQIRDEDPTTITQGDI